MAAYASSTAMSSLSNRVFAGLWDSKICSSTVVKCNSSVAPQRQTLLYSNEREDGELPSMSIVSGVLSALLRYGPIYRLAASIQREKIMKRGADLGHPWPAALAKIRLHDWNEELKKARNVYVEYPEYYLKPFHGYEKGHLSWDAAWEVELTTKSLHSTTFDPQTRTLDPDGDERLRRSYHEKLMSMLRSTPQAIVDIGCSTGLSTFGLHEVFPDALTVGVDLSPYSISVANFHLKERGKSKSVQFLHASGECTGLPSGVYDLVSVSLVCHELPRSATKRIIQEAYRLLKVGGSLSIMEMNPYSVHLQRMVKNIFVFPVFNASEPYFNDYRTFAIENAIAELGFTFPTQAECSPYHKTLVADKK